MTLAHNCNCLDPQYENSSWSELRIHTEQQDINCTGWQRLNELIEEAVRDKREEFSPGSEMTPTEWAQITELSAGIVSPSGSETFLIISTRPKASNARRHPPLFDDLSDRLVTLPLQGLPARAQNPALCT